MSNFFYDGQIRRYITQFMRVFIGFKYKTGGDSPEEKYVPVMYGDMTRQVASIIRENSENKLPAVPRIACYMTSLEMDMTRLSDATFVSKLNIRERAYDIIDGERQYKNTQGGNYTVERLMPTPYKLGLKADIWTSNTEQKLQLIEQILVLFNPSLELQTTDNYVDWTSLSVLDLNSVNISSRQIPVGTESEIDIASLEFITPIWISPPVKVKKLGIVKTIIANIFTEAGDLSETLLEDLNFNNEQPQASVRETIDRFDVLLLKNQTSGVYEVSLLNRYEAVDDDDPLEIPTKLGPKRLDWRKVLDMHGGYTGTSRIFFLQPNGFEINGTFTVNELDQSYLIVDFDIDTLPTNTEAAIDAIINPYRFNPIEKFGGLQNIPYGKRFLIIEPVNNSVNTGQDIRKSDTLLDSTGVNYDGPDGWKGINGDDSVLPAYSIIEWDGNNWIVSFDPTTAQGIKYVTNLTTGIQYKWEDGQWLKSFEGEYAAGYWRLALDA